jgi:inward rectifier potassium channel
VARSEEVIDGIVVVGASSHPLRDAYQLVLRMSWGSTLGLIGVVFLAANALFGFGYCLTGGVAGANPGSFRDAFFFSVQTMGTVGYGAMYPASTAANMLVVAESVFGVILTALATGIVFARFSRGTGTLVFTSSVCIAPMDGIPTIMVRVGNDAASTIFEATIRIVMTRTEKTDEGVVFYRLYDLTPTRDRSPAIARSWTALHPITERSPFHGLTPQRCFDDEVEILASVTGTDDTSLQPVHSRKRYEAKDFRWGARPADILSERPDGVLQLDVRKFDQVIETAPTADFPYPAALDDVQGS